MEFVIAALALAVIILLCAVWKLFSELGDAKEQITNLALSYTRLSASHEVLKTKVCELRDAYDKAEELIVAATEYAEESANTERKMQEGISSILNYDAMKALSSNSEAVNNG